MRAVDRLAPDTAVASAATRAVVNRRESPILPPDLSDEDLVGRWLAAKATGRGRLAATTLAQYRTEAERLFWYARQTGVPISNWGLDEFSAYIGFLQAPAPWAVRKHGVRRGSPDWRPFLGPLTDRSSGQTQKIVTSLFDWLRDVGYLQLNPATGLPTVGRREPEKQSRFLSPDDTALLRETIAARPGAQSGREARLANARDLFTVDLLERTGLRTSEVVQCRMGHVRIEPVPQTLRREFPDAPPSSGCCASSAARAAEHAGCRATRLRCRCRPTGSRLACHRCRHQTRTCRCYCRCGAPAGVNSRASAAAPRSGNWSPDCAARPSPTPAPTAGASMPTGLNARPRTGCATPTPKGSRRRSATAWTPLRRSRTWATAICGPSVSTWTTNR